VSPVQNLRWQAWTRSVPDFARIELDRLLSRFLEQLERAAINPDADGVHDLRVSIRRYSQALRAFEPLLRAKAVRKVRAQLREVMDAAAIVRDLDVGMETLLDEGTPEDDPMIESMRQDRRRAQMEFLGRLFLLRAKEPERTWGTAPFEDPA
jgi:CHAD domain-containing protein